jgi:hypothetical protein
MKHEQRAHNFRDVMKWLDGLCAPPATTRIGEVRATRGSCSNCGKRARAMLFLRGSQICARCVIGANDSLPHPAIKMNIVGRIRRLTRRLASA